MAESRGAKYHRGRLGESLRQEIETILEGSWATRESGWLRSAAWPWLTIPRSARVYVTVEGDDDEAATTLEGLSAAVGYIRRELTERLHLRRAPEITFQVDRTGQHTARVDELLTRAKKRSKSL